MPSPIPFREIRKKLEGAGYRLVRISSSHHIFEKPGRPNIVSIPVHRDKVKPVYGRKVQKIVEAEKQRDSGDGGEAVQS